MIKKGMALGYLEDDSEKIFVKYRLLEKSLCGYATISAHKLGSQLAVV